MLIKSLKKILKKKLDDKILDLIELPKGKTDKNILEYIRITQQNNFSDSSYLLKEMVYEIGKAQIENASKPSKKKGKLEKELEDYLEKNGNLEKIEKGLKFVGRQKSIESGRLDISAEDLENKQVIVELKTSDYGSKHVFWQLMKYMNEKEDDRLIFIAPQIKPDLYYPLQNYVNSGRISFFEVEKNGKEYNFQKVNKKNIKDSNNKEINFNTRDRKSDIVSIVKHEKEEKTEWDSLPFYYQIMLFYRPNLKNKKRYLKPIKINEKQKRDLEELVLPEYTKALLSKFNEMKASYVPKDELTKIANNRLFDLDTPKDCKIMNAGTSLGQNITNELTTIHKEISLCIRFNEKPIDCNQELSTLISPLERSQRKLDEYLKKIKHNEKDLIKYRKLLSKYSKRSSGDKRKYYKAALWDTFFYIAKLNNESLKLRIARSKKLMKVNNDIACSYFIYNITTDIMLDDFKNSRLRDAPFIVGPFDMYNFIKKDTELYQSFLDNFQVEKEKHIQNQPKELNSLPKKTLSSQPKLEDKYTTLKNTIIRNENSQTFTPNMLKRIDYFIEEDLNGNKISSKELLSLTDSFSGFNLPRLMKRDTKLPENNFYAFFDNINLYYMKNRKIPSSSDLKDIYNSSKKH